MHALKRHPASFRDPSGFIFRAGDGTLLRQVNQSYEPNYRRLMDSGLYSELVSDESLVEHEELPGDVAFTDAAYVVLRPRQIHFSSNPYEWPFSALKDAALLTLDVQRRALRYGMTLKDASAYNVQFDGSKPIFIDTLSFEQYVEGQPWQGYAQFCRHFLAPLMMMSKVDITLGKLLAVHLDGIPMSLASRLMPMRTWIQPGSLLHLHMHAKLEKWYSKTDSLEKASPAKTTKLSKSGLENLIGNLYHLIENTRWRPQGTEWADYYQTHSYSDAAFDQKRRTVRRFLETTGPCDVWDLGANTGAFSRLASDMGIQTWSFDIDPSCVEMNYLDCRKRDERRLHPLLLDLTNPSPALGWAHAERPSLFNRGPTDVILALALIHHLAISNNVPFDDVAAYFAQLCKHLVIEFVPKNDPQVRRLLRSRKDIFDRYDQATFETDFQRHFEIQEKVSGAESDRVLYLMKART